MSAINDITEAWAGHSGLEVETWLKSQIIAALSASAEKVGYVSFDGTTMRFYDYEGGSELFNSISFGGDVYTIAISCNLPQAFYILADEDSKIMTITPSTTVSPFGSSQSTPFPENYSYVVSVNNGGGYVPRITGNISSGGSASFDLKPFLSPGDNFIRVAVTGETSGQVRTMVFTGTLTTLWLTVTHAWQNVWEEGQPYTITGIRFAGAVAKELHVSVDGSEEFTPYVQYTAAQSYTTSATSYTIPAEAFPATENGIHIVRLWMTSQGVSTRQVSFNIMCVAEGDTTPLITINSITERAVNWTSGRLFSYAVYNADNALFDLSAIIGSESYTVASDIERPNLESGVQYDFSYSLEIDTGINPETEGTLTAVGTAFMGAIQGEDVTVTTELDNTYSYVATPGALFYMNASTRTNSEADREYMRNEMGASEDGNFAATYLGTWSGFSWSGDAWANENVSINGATTSIPALIVPAGCSVSFPGFAPMSFFGDSRYESGMTFEIMIKNSYPADYDTPILTLGTSGASPSGIFIYPTRILVLGSYERSEVNQSVNISENRMTHVCITFVRKYEGKNEKNLCSVYINGISNVNFAFDASTGWGNGSLAIGQQNADTLVYRMRVYGEALDSGAVFNNFLNSVVDGLEFNRRERMEKNNILYGNDIRYEDVKAAGYNTMVIITPNNVPIPSYYNQSKVKNCTWRFEYAGHPEWNVTLENIPIDGQGTTSMRYFRWNERGKTASDTVWNYGDGTSEPGKEGYFINDGVHIRVDRVTAKKNVASSPQGHKMGMTGLYNDLFKQVGLGSHLPDSSFRVSVFQYPFVGFQYNSNNDSYDFIGLYTAGPDKGSKVTFGYKKSAYPNCLSIEGPNHNPRGTRFLHPWVDVEYSPEDETLKFGGQEGWDVDYVKYETTYGDDGETFPDDWAAIRALYESEWRPAYECVYNNSPHIASVAEVLAAVQVKYPEITSLADLLNQANITKLSEVTVPGMSLPVTFIAFYDTSYELYFFRNKDGRFEKLADVALEVGDNTLEHNVRTPIASYLDTQSPTTAQLIAARAARFKATAANYWDMDQTLFHYAYCELFGVSDNFAKNSYPFKFRKFQGEDLATGESVYVKRWGWRQDDLDTVMMTDNNGNQTKKYSVEPGDTIDVVEQGGGVTRTQIFQGYNSALWVLIHDNYFDDIRTMMLNIATGAQTLATNLGIAGNGMHGSLFNLTSYYCWEQSAKYFAETMYEKDRRWTYIEPWLLAGTVNPQTGETYPALYNGVAPLTQALGDQYQSERLWMERRIPYIFSKYHIGAFDGSTSGYGMISFTLASTFTFELTPAIDLYPTATSTEDTEQDGRKQAGEVAEITLATTGDSNNYIKGGDWLADLGDLSGMALSARGGGDIAFDVSCTRLLALKVGDANAANVRFNADSLTVSSPSITEIDARNTVTVRNLVNLSNCPRLRIVRFAGSGATGMILPVGAKVTVVSFPSAAQNVYLQSLAFLEAENLTLPTLTNVKSLYVYNCQNLNPFEILATIFGAAGNTLQYVTAIWPQTLEVDADTLELLTEMTGLPGSVSYADGAYSNVNGKPVVEGTLREVETLYADDIDKLNVISEENIGDGWKRALSNLFESPLYVEYNPSDVYIKFADANVKSICVSNWDTNGDGEISMPEALAVTRINSGPFNSNTSITSFDELKYFKNIIDYDSAFVNCSSLRKITFPEGIKFQENNFYRVMRNCSSLEDLDISDAVRSGNQMDRNSYLFDTAPSLTTLRAKSVESLIGFMPTTTFYGPCTPFYYNSDTHYVYIDGVELRDCVIPDTVTSIRPGSFYRFNRMTSITIPSSVTSIGANAFQDCSGLTGTLTIPSTVTSIGNSAFAGCSGLTNFICDCTIPSLDVIENLGNGAGIIKVSGDFSNVPGINNALVATRFKCKHFILNGSILSSGANSCLIGNNSTIESVRISGSVNMPSGSRMFYTNPPAIKFIEIGGEITNAIYYSSRKPIVNYDFHLGYDGIACPPSYINMSDGYIQNVYVGDGSSAAHDNAILAQYTADSEWSAYASKLDTWYNYVQSGGEYATPPTPSA